MLKTMKQMLVMLCVTAMCCLMIPAWTVAAETYGDIQYTIIKDEANVIGYVGSPTDVVIPDTLGGYPVKRIQNSSFDGCTSMESVSIPASVTSIGTDAFRNCTSLTAVHISDIDAWCSVAFGANGGGNDANPLYYAGNLYLNGELVTDLVFAEGLTKVNDYAFYNCTSLESVVLSDSVTTIGSNAFEKCTSLESIYIPAGVTQIGIYAFYKCNSLTDVYYGGNQEQWEAIEYSFGNDLLTDASNIQYTPAMHYNAKAIGYDNTYVNTGYGAADLIGVAETQVGYLEGTLEGNTYIDNNYQKYGVWYDEAVENINAANSVWDAVFVTWCADQADIPDSVIPRNAYVPYSTTWFKNKGLYYDSEAQGGSYIPEKGDLIFFGDTMPTHMGIVTEVTDTYVRTIEGNATDPSDAYGLTQGVFTKQYNLNYTRIFGYASPAYDAAINPSLVSYYKGDVNADWMVSTTDARNILMDVLTDGDVVYNAVADFDQNGAVNTSDARELVIDVINEVAPTLVTPPAATVAGMPSGEEIAFTQTVSVELWGDGGRNDECYVVQSLDELKAFYAADEGWEDYTASFSEDFFRVNALVLVKVHATALPRATYISEIVKNDDNALTVHLVEEYNAGVEPIIYHERMLLTVAKADLADVTEVRLFEDVRRDLLDEYAVEFDVDYIQVANSTVFDNGEPFPQVIDSEEKWNAFTASDPSVDANAFYERRYYDASFFETKSLIAVPIYGDDLVITGVTTDNSMVTVNYTYLCDPEYTSLQRSAFAFVSVDKSVLNGKEVCLGNYEIQETTLNFDTGAIKQVRTQNAYGFFQNNTGKYDYYDTITLQSTEDIKDFIAEHEAYLLDENGQPVPDISDSPYEYYFEYKIFLEEDFAEYDDAFFEENVLILGFMKDHEYPMSTPTISYYSVNDQHILIQRDQVYRPNGYSLMEHEYYTYMISVPRESYHNQEVSFVTSLTVDYSM